MSNESELHAGTEAAIAVLCDWIRGRPVVRAKAKQGLLAVEDLLSIDGLDIDLLNAAGFLELLANEDDQLTMTSGLINSAVRAVSAVKARRNRR